MTIKTRALPIYRRIADELRAEMAGQLRPGDMLPSENDLVKRYAVHRGTIRQSLDILAREGLIHRHHGRGSVVADRLATGDCAIVVRPQLLDPLVSPFYNLASTAIMRRVGARHPLWNMRMHVGKETPTGEEFPGTLDLLDPNVLGTLRGVFSFHALWELEPKLWAANVPVVVLGTFGTYVVTFSMESFFAESVAHLRAVGCRSVGAIWNCEPATLKGHPHAALIAKVLKPSLKYRPEWVQPYMGGCTELAGYESLMRLWSSGSRPDSILVLDDVVCRGVLRAALQLGIDIPRQLRLITWANRGVELPYHKPVTRVEFDPAELAREAVEMMEVLQSGKEPPQRIITLSGKLAKGEST